MVPPNVICKPSLPLSDHEALIIDHDAGNCLALSQALVVADGVEEDQLTDSGSDGDQEPQVAPSSQTRSKANDDTAQEPPAKRARTRAKGMSKARWTGLAKVSLVRHKIVLGDTFVGCLL